jgi:hypothetical protein
VVDLLKPNWSKNPWAWSLLGFSIGLFLFMQMFPADIDSAKSYAFYFPWRCPINLLTGFNCLGCGLTRSVLLVLSGDFSAAFQMHALGPFAAAAISFHVVAWVYNPALLDQVYRVKLLSFIVRKDATDATFG